MIFIPGTKVYVSYSTGISQPFTECLTVRAYKNNLLFFEEKSDFYAVECHEASFYGFSHTNAGKVIITKQKWQLPLADLADKLGLDTPVKPAKQPRENMRVVNHLQLSDM